MNYDETKSVLCSLCLDGKIDDVNKSLDELEKLLNTAGGVCLGRMVQNKDKMDVRTLFGSGKVEELKEFCKNNEIELVVFDTDLSPSQIRNIEDSLEEDTRVIDRSMLILDIFAKHAITNEGKLQVELAQLKYSAPRLMGKGKDLSRLGGGIGTRGPGESQLETDRRHLARRIQTLENELQIVEKNRRTMRISRDKSGLPKVAIVGYTNAGKSTILNYLTNAGILAEDKLFATLDPTTRKFALPSGEEILLTDTVGFIKKLPHHLIHAFKSTLDEAVYADVLMIVVDMSDPEYADQLKVTENLLCELGAAMKPTIYVYNKCDACGAPSCMVRMPGTISDIVCVSAKSGDGMNLLLDKLVSVIHGSKEKVVFHIPNSEGGALNTLYQNAQVEDVQYGEKEMIVTAIVDKRTHGMLKKYDPLWKEPSDE